MPTVEKPLVDNHAALPFMPGRVGSFAPTTRKDKEGCDYQAMPCRLNGNCPTSCLLRVSRRGLEGKKGPTLGSSLRTPRGYYLSDIGHHDAEGFRLNDG